jgi:hypothetical protein
MYCSTSTPPTTLTHTWSILTIVPLDNPICNNWHDVHVGLMGYYNYPNLKSFPDNGVRENIFESKWELRIIIKIQIGIVSLALI